MKIRREYIIKMLIILLYLSPFVVAYFKGERVSFSKVYYIGLFLSALSLIKFKDEVLNNCIFALTLVILPISLVLISMYFF